MRITTTGLDIAKSVFQVHGVDEAGERYYAQFNALDMVA